MFTKKHHIVRKIIIISTSFILGVLATVIAAATYDASIQNRAGSMLKSIKSNASTLPSSEKVAYYTLVHNNIQSLIQVLTGVDTNVMVELGTTTGAIVPITCSYTYSEYGICENNGIKKRTIISTLPLGCSGGDPEILVRSCTYNPENITPLLITTRSPLPAVTTRKQYDNFKFEYAGGDGSMPIWSNCSGNFVGQDVNYYGYIIGTRNYDGKRFEDSICVMLKVGSQVVRKSFIIPVIQNPNLDLIITTPANLHTGNVGKMYREKIETSQDKYTANVMDGMKNGTSCDGGGSTFALSSGSLPPGLSMNGEVISGIPSSAGTFTFTVKNIFISGCTPVTLETTKELTLVINAPSMRDLDAPVISNFRVQVDSLRQYFLNNYASLRSNSTFVVPKQLKLRFTVNTNCKNSREAHYYLINIDGKDFEKDGKKVHYDVSYGHKNNMCDRTGQVNILQDRYNISPEELGLSEGTHKIIFRGCTSDGHCSPLDDGVPICDSYDNCRTIEEKDQPCNMYSDWSCANHPLATMPAFILHVGPTIAGIYTAKESIDSADSLLVQDAVGPKNGGIILGLDMSRSPKICKELPGSNLCSIGQGEYYPATVGTSPGVVQVGTSTDDPTGRYEWYVRYGNEAPIHLGGYTTMNDSKSPTYSYRGGCSSDYGISKDFGGSLDSSAPGQCTKNASIYAGFSKFMDQAGREISCQCMESYEGENLLFYFP